MMQNSKYTVLMSVYYKEKPEYLSLSIESMLNQTVKPDEFIIVKDGPLTTELDEVINNFVTAYPKTFNIMLKSFITNVHYVCPAMNVRMRQLNERRI